MNKIIFPYYSGYIKFTKVIGHIDIKTFVERHKYPKKEISDLFDRIKEADLNGDKKLKRALKQDLFSFTPSVFINKNRKRNYNNIEYYTGVMQLDFDKLANEKEAQDLKEHLFNNYNEIITAYLSPSRQGVKCLMAIDPPIDKFDYRNIFNSVANEFENISYFDYATKNAVLPLFLSHDYNILYRDKPKIWSDRLEMVIEYKHLNEPGQPQLQSNDYYYNKTVRIFTNKLNNINNNGHPQLVSACLILGSRAGAGYISNIDAINLSENLIKQNKYFQKDLNNYLKTSKWAINQGLNNPKEYGN